MSRAELREAAMKLPTDEKVQLAEELLASIDPAEQAEIDASWAVEVERRIKLIDVGKSESIPAEELFKQLRGQRP
jgi:putative addiction module component (TIGR02574 family)